MANRLKDKITIITGAARGIGAKSAELFASEGAAIAIWDLNVERGEATAQQIQTSGGAALFCECDVTDTAQIESAAAQVTSELGTPNVLFNNAGIAVVGELEEISEEDWDRQYAVNVKSIYDARSRWRFDHQHGKRICLCRVPNAPRLYLLQSRRGTPLTKHGGSVC
ncbi:SDR family NAD(P)-dependent oxidoreductase [Candidatus Poribacteria bacterium]|nr:SDR family NAD(P)-dependent oxidoreductase [Candidatus Poribacteria bacterium]